MKDELLDLLSKLEKLVDEKSSDDNDDKDTAIKESTYDCVKFIMKHVNILNGKGYISEAEAVKFFANLIVNLLQFVHNEDIGVYALAQAQNDFAVKFHTFAFKSLHNLYGACSDDCEVHKND